MGWIFRTVSMHVETPGILVMYQDDEISIERDREKERIPKCLARVDFGNVPHADTLRATRYTCTTPTVISIW